jgi:hypothetical protein
MSNCRQRLDKGERSRLLITFLRPCSAWASLGELYGPHFGRRRRHQLQHGIAVSSLAGLAALEQGALAGDVNCQGWMHAAVLFDAFCSETPYVALGNPRMGLIPMLLLVCHRQLLAGLMDWVMARVHPPTASAPQHRVDLR